MIFFSSLAFKVLEKAMSVIFRHRGAERRRPFLLSTLLPFVYIAFIGIGFLVGTLMFSELIAIGEEKLVILGHAWSLGGFSRFLLYLVGVAGEILVISSVYFFVPAVRVSASHALIGGTAAALLWEIIRHGLAWYFATLSQVSLVYGSLTTAIVVLLALEVAAALLLFGAQVIAEYDRLATGLAGEAPPAMEARQA
jgi:YihY family inner membrane protein